MELSASAKPHLEGIKNYQPGKPIEEVEREYGVKNALKMASNENALGPSPKAVEAIRKSLSRIHRYPDGGCFYLRKKLSAFLGVKPEMLVFGNGSDEVLVLAARAFAGPGDEVIIANPTFLIYEIAAQAQAARVVKVPMKNFRYDLPAMAKKITPKTKLIFVANPDNPIGTYVSQKEVTAFLSKVPAGIPVVLDEAYFEFAGENKDYPDWLKLLSQFKNLIVARTFSKAYGLSGLRIGYGVADPGIVNALNKVREPFNVNSLAQTAALAALDDKAHLRRTLQTVSAGKKYLYKEAKRLGLFYIQSATNFVLIDLEKNAAEAAEALIRKGVIIRAMTAWGLNTFIRVTVGRKEENQKFVKALNEIMRSLR